MDVCGVHSLPVLHLICRHRYLRFLRHFVRSTAALRLALLNKVVNGFKVVTELGRLLDDCVVGNGTVASAGASRADSALLTVDDVVLEETREVTILSVTVRILECLGTVLHKALLVYES